MRVQKVNKEVEIKEVFELLWDILSLYEESDCYNYLPGTKDSEGAWEYFDGLILNVRKKANSSFLGERDSEEYRKLNTIIDETGKFVKCFERPGVAHRWREIDPHMHCAFKLISECGPKAFVEAVNRGMLAYIPMKEDITNRKHYFEMLKRKNDTDNLRYSETRMFQNELLETLTKVFRHDFCEYAREDALERCFQG